MTPHDLLANFETLAEAPNGVQRMRELVLELAIRGKLVDQAPGDEPVSELITRIKTDKEKLVRAKKIRAGKPIQKIADDEIPFPIPPSWSWIRLGDIGDWGAGATPTRGNSAFYGGDIYWFKSGELNDGSLAGPSVETITVLALSKFSLRENRPGDVLIALYGATIGKLAILESPGTTNQAVCACTCFADTYNRYLFLFLMAWRRRFTAQGAGGAQPNISKEKVVATTFPLPPLPEQRRIVARVDELMALLDRLEAKRQESETARTAARDSALSSLRGASTPDDVETAWLRIQDRFGELFTTPEDIQPLRELVVDLAVSGKLVAQKPEDGHAMDLVYKFPRVTWGGPGRTLLDSRAVVADPPTASVKLPSTWALLRLEMLTALDKPISYGVLVPGENIEGGVPLVRIGDLTTSKNPPMPAKSISRTIADEYSRVLLEGGELLLGVVGSIGKVGKAPDSWRGAVIARAVARIATIPLVESHYLLLVLQSSLVQRYFRGETRTLAQPTLNVGLIRSTPIPLPPIQEQVRIVARVDELMKMLDRLAGAVEGGMALSRAFAAAAVHNLEA